MHTERRIISHIKWDQKSGFIVFFFASPTFFLILPECKVFTKPFLNYKAIKANVKGVFIIASMATYLVTCARMATTCSLVTGRLCDTR